MGHRSNAALVATTLVACAVGAAAQAPSPVFRISAELVVVDLVATDRAGRFVADLQPGDIQVFEDGKPQTVRFVTVVRRGVPDARASSIDPADASEPVSRGGSEDASRGLTADPPKLVVVVDLASTPADALPRVRDAVRSMVTEELPDGPEVMFATLWQGLSIQQPFTRDRVTVATAVSELAVPSGNGLGYSELLDTSERLCDTFQDRPDLVLRQLVSLGRGIIDENQRQLTTSSENLSALARSLAAAPGRKHVVFFSSGYALNATSHVIELVAAAYAACGGDAEQARRVAAQELTAAGSFDAGPFERMLDRANRSQVSIYTVDPRGLMTTSPEAQQRVSARATRRGQAQRFRALEATVPQEYLRAVAADTGGRSFLNSNDLTQGLRRAWLDANEYYLVGYEPPGARKAGRFHRIEVKVTRPDLDVRYRRGYYAATDQEIATSDVEQAIARPDLFRNNGLEIDVETAGAFRVIMFLPPHALRFTEAGRVNEAAVTLHAVLRDDAGRLVGGKPLFGRDIGLKLDARQLEGLLSSDHVEIPVTVDLPLPGAYRLTVVARDSGGWIGAQTLDVTIDP